jgi:outer membrane protein OmpA-like peptidoglycan-associated protein
MLDSAGHVALYINFDFGKATLKPDAKPVIDQILALLSANATLKLAIEGHTDNVGGSEANQKLSEQRAQAVVAALVQGGVAADRLSAAGYGAGKPVADNTSVEGRAKNRRVELVKR